MTDTMERVELPLCACGCGDRVERPNWTVIAGHRRLCACGCGDRVEQRNRQYRPGHCPSRRTTRLPWAPIQQAMIARLGVPQQIAGAHPKKSDANYKAKARYAQHLSDGSGATVPNIARYIGIEVKEVQRYQASGLLLADADFIATRLGKHPTGFWPEWYELSAD